MRLSSDEIQIELDDVYACPGSCPGCVLTKDERKVSAPDMSNEVRHKILRLLPEYIKTLSGLKTINITYGIADHLLMPVDYLLEIYEDAANVFDDVGLNGSVFMTTSVIGKTEMVYSKLDALASATEKRKVRLFPIVVLDPAKLEHHKFGTIYADHIAYAKKRFGVVDLAINLSTQAIQDITPKELVDFAESHGFREVTVNWVPTVDNVLATYSPLELKKLEAWLLDFALRSAGAEIESSYVPVIKRSYDAWRCVADSNDESESLGVLPVVEKIIPETLRKSIQFDHKGNVFGKWEAVGDVPSNERVNFKVWGNILDVDSLETLVSSGVLTSTLSAVKATSYGPCVKCVYAPLCASTGFHIYTHVLNKAGFILKTAENNCPHIAKTLWLNLGKD